MRTIMIGVAVVAVGLVVWLGGFLEFQGIRNVVWASRSRTWPTTLGTVVSTETSRDTSVDRRSREEQVIYSAKTVVRYRVDGRDYATNRVHFGQDLGSSDPSEAELQRLRYPPGGTVRVSYDPHQPWLAILKPGLHAEAFGLPIAGLAFLLPALAAVAMFPNMFRAWSGKSDWQRGGDSGMAVAAAVFALLFTTLGLLGLGFGLRRMWNGHASLRWPTTLGEVVFANVETSQSRDEQTNETSTAFSPRFVYRYEVDGVPHFNNLRRFGRVEGEGADWAAQIAARYPVGTKVPVAYYSTDPDVAVLEPGNDSEALFLPGVGLVALLLGLGAFVFVVPGLGKGFSPRRLR